MLNTGSHPFTFDAESRETSAGTATYKYDGDSLRVYKFDSQSSSNNRLYWRGGGIPVLSHTDLSGNIQKELIYFAGMPIASYNGTNGDHYYLYEDWQGSVRAITNSSGSTTEWAADYFPWGQVQNQIANSIDWRYRWVGQEYDPEVQSYSFPFRYYRPQTGNFMSADPAGLDSRDPSNPQSLDRYAYVLGDPVNNLDPLGLSAWEHGDTWPPPCSAMTAGTLGCSTVIMDGVEVSMDSGLVGQGGESIVACPANNCAGYGTTWHLDSTGQYVVTYDPVTSASGTFTAGITLTSIDTWNLSLSQVAMANWQRQQASSADTLGALGQAVLGPQTHALWSTTSNYVDNLAVATALVPVAAAAAGEAAVSPAGDFLFARGTGLLNSNDYFRLGWTWARTSLLDYPYGGLTYFGIRILNWHLNSPVWSYPTGH